MRVLGSIFIKEKKLDNIVIHLNKDVLENNNEEVLYVIAPANNLDEALTIYIDIMGN